MGDARNGNADAPLSEFAGSRLRSAKRALLSSLLDDAALFPPARLAMAEALHRHHRYRASRERWMLGRFVCPLSRVDELRSVLAPAARLELSLVLETPAVEIPVDAEERFVVRCVEWRLPELGSDEAEGVVDDALARSHRVGSGAETFIEVPLDASRSEDVARTLAAIERSRANETATVGLKARCGGGGADAAPSPERLAAFIARCVEAGVAFKATAGLHHPIRGARDADGSVMHGFLNLLAAARLARAASVDELAAVLDDRDPAHFELTEHAFAYRGAHWSSSQLVEMRATRLRAIGSCSFDEPTDGLRALGMLTPEERG